MANPKPESKKPIVIDMHSHIINKDLAQICITDGVNSSVLYLNIMEMEALIDLVESTQEGMRAYERN